MRPWCTGPSGERGTKRARRVGRPPDGPGQRGPEKGGDSWPLGGVCGVRGRVWRAKGSGYVAWAALGLVWGFLAATPGPELGEIGAGSRDCFSLRRGLRRMEGRLEGLRDLGAGPKDCLGPP